MSDCPHARLLHDAIDQSMVCQSCHGRWVRDLRILDGENKTTTLSSKQLRMDYHGRLVFDSCTSDYEHLLAITPEGQERRRCGVPVENLFPDNVLGRYGEWEIGIRFKEGS